MFTRIVASKHCQLCGPKKSCNLHHVYVIELECAVLDEPNYCKNDRPIPEGSRCFYVGESWHRPECRYNQHVAKPLRRNFICSCKDGIEIRKPFHAGNKSSKYPNKYHKPGGLCPKLYRHLNPIRGGKKAAKKAEQALAETLKKAGHAAHFG